MAWGSTLEELEAWARAHRRLRLEQARLLASGVGVATAGTREGWAAWLRDLDREIRRTRRSLLDD